MKKIATSFLMASVLISSGCASIVSGTSQDISLRSNTPGTSLYVNGEFVGIDQAETTFKKRKNYLISAEKEGCKANTIKAEKSVDPATMGGILIDFGLVSILMVDMLITGAWKQFDETSFVTDPLCDSLINEDLAILKSNTGSGLFL